MGHDVFISYNEASSRQIMLRVVEKLESQGIRCWYAPRNVYGDFGESITEAIESCRVFVVLLNKAASESKHVKNELYIASECNGVEMLPFHIADSNFSGNIKYYLGRHHWVDGTKNLDSGIEELCDRILRLLGREKPTDQGSYITLTYCGQTYQVKAETKKYKSGLVYSGELVKGKRHGKGKLIWPGKDVYEGEFVNDVIHGQGKYTWSNGDVFEGEYRNGVRCGKGKEVMTNGHVYEGEFRDDKRNGNARFFWPDGSVYVGDFVNGKLHGKGKLVLANGDVYEGSFADGKRSGCGTYTPVNGKILAGRFDNDEYIGKK